MTSQWFSGAALVDVMYRNVHGNASLETRHDAPDRLDDVYMTSRLLSQIVARWLPLRGFADVSGGRDGFRQKVCIYISYAVSYGTTGYISCS